MGAVLAALSWGWLFPGGSHPPSSTTTTAPVAGTPFQLPDPVKTLAAYAGSASCRECHAAEFDRWGGSHHALAERPVSEARDAAAFTPGRTLGAGPGAVTVARADGRFTLTAANSHQAATVYPVERVLGEAPLRQWLVPFAGGRWQAAAASWDPAAGEWFSVFGAEERQPGEWGHWTGRGMNWNSMCANCHNTRLRKNYSPADDTYHTTMAEPGVGCEACHGPMKAHNEWQRAHPGAAPAGGDPTHPRLTRDQMLETCAHCHSRRGEITGDPVPGERFYDHELLSIVDHSDLFHADGQVREEDYEFSAFLGSRMFHRGVRCWDCHEPHAAKPALTGNALCLKCHSGAMTNAPIIQPAAHSHHFVAGGAAAVGAPPPGAAPGSGGECVNCHMPQTTYMQRHPRHDHGFTIPDPKLTVDHGIPNACNRCHTNRDAGWAAGRVAAWYGDKMERPYRRHAVTVAHARSGDAGAPGELRSLLDGDEQFYWRAVAAGLLGRWVADPGVRTSLVNHFADPQPLVRQQIAQALAGLGDDPPADVRAALTTHLTDSSRAVRVMAAQALAATVETNSGAGSELLHLLAHGADQPAGRLQAGGFQFARGDLTNALRQYQTAAAWDPLSAGLHHETAIVLGRLGRGAEAVTELREAVRLAPNDAEYHFKLGLALNEIGDAMGALGELEQAVRRDPRHPRAGYNLGLARNAAGDFAGAIMALQAAGNADPADPAIPYAQATIHARLGQVPEARRAARRALEINPRFAEAAALLDQLAPP